MKYSAAFKAKMVQKMLGGRSANSLAQEIGMNQPTLSKWLRDASSLRAVKRREQNEPGKTEGRRPDDWSAEEKLEAVLEAKRLSDSELGESCVDEGYTRSNFGNGSRRRTRAHWSLCAGVRRRAIRPTRSASRNSNAS